MIKSNCQALQGERIVALSAILVLVGLLTSGCFLHEGGGILPRRVTDTEFQGKLPNLTVGIVGFTTVENTRPSRRLEEQFVQRLQASGCFKEVIYPCGGNQQPDLLIEVNYSRTRNTNFFRNFLFTIFIMPAFVDGIKTDTQVKMDFVPSSPRNDDLKERWRSFSATRSVESSDRNPLFLLNFPMYIIYHCAFMIRGSVVDRATAARQGESIANQFLYAATEPKHQFGRLAAILSNPPTEIVPTVAVAEAGELLKRRGLALVIGINAYKFQTPLLHAVEDAKRVASILRSNYGFQVMELYDDEATRKAILGAVEKLVAGLKEGDNVFIYFSGHGEYSDVLKQGYWVPVEAENRAEYIPNNEIDALVNSMGKAQHVFLVADSCFSGSFLGLVRGIRGERPEESEEKVKLQEFFREQDGRKSRLVLASGAAQERVPDVSEFARQFIDGLRNAPDQVLTMEDLARKVQKYFQERPSLKQTPQIRYFKSENEWGQMVLPKK